MNTNVAYYNINFFQYLWKSIELQLVKWWFQVKTVINDSYDNEELLYFACQSGNLQKTQWLLEVQPNINISAKNEEAFRLACFYGHLPLAQLLVEFKPTINISAKNEEAFRFACINGHLHVAQWLQSINPSKYKIISYNEETKKISFVISEGLNTDTEIVYVDTLDTCPICDESKCHIQTKCNHNFCEECIITWLDKSKRCPYCRDNLDNTLFHTIQTKSSKV